MPAPPLVLVVDDDPTLRAILSRVLEREGIGVTAVGSGAAANEALAAGSVQAIIVDQNLPDTTGTALAARLSDALGADCPPCLLITASPDTIAEEALALFSAVLPKPFSLPELAAAVRKVTDGQDAATDETADREKAE